MPFSTFIQLISGITIIFCYIIFSICVGFSLEKLFDSRNGDTYAELLCAFLNVFIGAILLIGFGYTLYLILP